MGGDLTASVGARVEEIMTSARQTAEALAREVRLGAEEDAGRPAIGLPPMDGPGAP
ncbi:MAG TPA: hypothetical protein VIL49_18790 [Capillimicrobium sp.]|jgi:hypothetical protein